MEKAGLGLVPENEIIQINSKAKLERGRDKNKGRRGGVGKEAGRRRPWNKRSARGRRRQIAGPGAGTWRVSKLRLRGQDL